jgi:hypothetical protein
MCIQIRKYGLYCPLYTLQCRFEATHILVWHHVSVVSESQGSHPPTPFHHATTKSRDRLDQIRDTKDAHLWPWEIMSNQVFAQFSQVFSQNGWWRPRTLVGTYKSSNHKYSRDGSWISSRYHWRPCSHMELLQNYWFRWVFNYIFQCLFWYRACKGSSLLSQLQNAIKMRAKHKALFVKFSERFSQVQITQWTRVIELWEEDPRLTNPYDKPDACESFVIPPLIYEIWLACSNVIKRSNAWAS